MLSDFQQLALATVCAQLPVCGTPHPLQGTPFGRSNCPHVAPGAC